MKKILIKIFVFTCIIIFTPAFLVNLYDKDNNKQHIIQDEIEEEEVVTTFSSNTCFKKTYYINKPSVDVYRDNTGRDNVIHTLNKDDIIIAYKDEKGYLYCEFDSKDSKINRGWIKKNSENLKDNINKNTEYVIDVNLTNQKIYIYKDDNILKNMRCSTGRIGYPDTETPLGIFTLLIKGKDFYSNKYNEGAKYYIKFFNDYLIHSVPVDKKGNIIEEEKEKLGMPASHGCIRLSMEDAKWIYENVPIGSMVYIHY